MEPAFGVDLGGVRIHTGARADRLNRSLGARAFTTGNDVFFGHGQFRPGTADGRYVLAHEITHTVQQSSSTQQPKRASRIARSSSPAPAITTARPGEEPRIRRLAYNQNPNTWGAPATLNRRRSGEGAEGVFFVNDAGPVFAAGTVVVKPLRSSGEIKFANKFLNQGMGFETPDEITYAKTSAEGVALQNVLTTAGVAGLKSPTEAQTQVNGASQMMVMSMVAGKSVQTLSDNEAVEFLQNEDALKEVGHLMVSDAFLGNQDRLVGVSPVNLGNFFYAAAGAMQRGRVTTIDNDSSFLAATRKANGSLDGQLVDKVFFIEQLCSAQGKLYFINKFLTRMRGAHQNNANTLAEINANTGWISHKISTGIDEGLRDISTVFTNNMDLVRSIRAINDPHSANKRHSDEAKSIGHYINARQSGTDPATALTKLSTYVEYRSKRNKFPRGLKWMSKIKSNRGF